MTTLQTILDLIPYAAVDFSSDAFIQIEDYETCAHYRMNKDGLTLGGNPVLCSMEQLMRLPVRCIEYINDQCVINIGDRGTWA